MGRSRTIDALLKSAQPSIRYLARTQVLGAPESDPEVRADRAEIPRTGWAADILSEQRPGGYWVGADDLYRPKYRSTNWMLLILADLGITRS
ncbi:MAG TPA: hypothetical protein VLY85_00350, partial [Thermoplasmata archaeon]|nr:hypothetical protein [Thermoplasmata archaeon]